MLRAAKRGWQWVKHTSGLLVRLDGRLTHVHERISEVTRVLERLERRIAEHTEPGAPVSVYLLGHYMADVPIPGMETAYPPVNRTDKKERWTITAKTVWMQKGQHETVEFMVQRPLMPGALVFVGGPALMTNLRLGQDSQCVFAPSLGVIGCIGTDVPIGLLVAAELEWVAPGTLRSMRAYGG